MAKNEEKNEILQEEEEKNWIKNTISLWIQSSQCPNIIYIYVYMSKNGRVRERMENSIQIK